MPCILPPFLFYIIASHLERLQAEAEKLKAEPEVIDSTDSDSDSIQITGVSQPSRSVTAEPRHPAMNRYQNAQAGPSGVRPADLNDDLYGSTSDGPRPRPPTNIDPPRAPKPQTAQASTTNFQPYASPLYAGRSSLQVSKVYTSLLLV